MADLPKILFIDAATKFGAALGRPGERPLSWSNRWARPSASHGALGAGAMRIALEMLRRHQPDEVVIEAPLAANQVNKRTNDDTITVLKGIPFAIQGYLHMHGFFKVSLAVVADIRMHFIGRNPKGEIAKPLVWEKCRAMGWIMPEDVDYRSTDRTDALAGWSYVETKLFPRLATPVDNLWVAVQKKRESEIAAVANKKLAAIAEHL